MGENKKKFVDQNQLAQREQEYLSAMSKKELLHLQAASALDQKMIAIQRSTRVNIQQLSYLHNFLRTKLGWYYRWHQNRYASLTHIFVLMFAVLSILGVSAYSLFYAPVPVKAELASGSSGIFEFDQSNPPSFVIDTNGLITETKLKEGSGELAIGDKKISASLSLADANISLKPEIVSQPQNPDRFAIKFDQQNQFSPGLHTLSIRLDISGNVQTIEQDFLWGVLSINPDQSLYKLGETSTIAMGVLDDRGNMVCDAKLDLEITDPDNKIATVSTADGTIKISPECAKRGSTELPDYYSVVKPTQAGTYKLHLKAETPNGVRETNDFFVVQENPEITIKRYAPTRIYPAESYPVKIEVSSAIDFPGPIREKVPASFAITPQEGLEIEEVGMEKILTWQHDFLAGEVNTFSYEFDAPDISPEFYLTGPVQIGPLLDPDGLPTQSDHIFKEGRQWEIASDAVLSVAGVCKQYDRTTNCADGETVMIAVNGVLQAQTATTATGAWTISGVTALANDIITVFIDNVADANEANAVAKIAAVPANITGVALYERHLTIGASSNQTLINANLAQYDNSVSADEDIFFEVDDSMNLTLPATGTQTATDQQLYLMPSNPFNPNAAGGKVITVPNLNIPTSATLTAGPNTYNITASGSPFTRVGTFTATSSTFNYVGSGATNVTATTYANLGIGTTADTGAGVTYTLAGNITVTGVFTLGNASSTNNDTLNASSRIITLSGSGTPLVKTAKGIFSYGTSTVNYAGTDATNIAVVNYYNLGVGTTSNTTATTYSLTGAITIYRVLTIGNASSTVNDTLAAGANNITFSSAAGTVFVLTTKGVFNPGTARVSYSGDANTVITATTYYDLYVDATVTADRTFTTGTGAISVARNFLFKPYGASNPRLVPLTLSATLTVVGTSTIEASGTARPTLSTGSNLAYSTGALVITGANATVNLNASELTLSGSGTVFTNTSGSFQNSSATIIYTGASATNVAALTYKNLTINHAAVTFTAAGDMNISGVFTITAGTFDASSRTITLSGTGTPFVNNGTLTPSTSTFKFTGIGDVTVASTTYNNLETKPADIVNGWTVTNSVGDSTYGGTYLASGTFNGQSTYYNGSRWLYYNYDEFMCMCYSWVMNTSVVNMADASMQAAYYTGTSLPGTWYENYNVMNGPAPTLEAYSATPVYTFSAGTLDVAGTYVNGDGTHAVDTTAATNNPLVHVHGNFTNSAGSVYRFSTANTNLSGNFTNATGATLATLGSTVVLDGSALQTITMNGTDQNHDFATLTITNASAAGVVFADSMTTATLVATTASSKITFTAGITISVANIVINGQATGTRVSLSSSVAGSPWYLISTDATPTISNTSVKDSDASGGLGIEALTTNGNLDATGNTNWWFEAAAPIGISGILYTNDLNNTTGLAAKTIGLSVNGGSVTTAETDANGNYTFSSVSVRDNDILTFFIKQETEKGTFIVKTGTISGDLSNLFFNAGYVKLHHLAGGEITNEMMELADSSNDADLMFSVTNGVATFADGMNVNVRGQKTYRPGGNVILDDLTINGTMNIENNNLTVSGSFLNNGTFSSGGSSNITFDSVSTGETITSAGAHFDHVTFNKVGGGWSPSDALYLNGDLTVTAGTLSGTNNITVNGGDVSGNGTINMTGGTFLVDGVGNFGGNTNWTFSGLTFGDGTGSATTTKAGSGNVTSSGVLTIAANQTLNAGDDTWTLSGSGTPLVINGTFQEGTSTFIYTGSSPTNVTGTTYYNLTTNHTGVTFTSAGSTEIKNVFTIQAGTFNASNSTIVLSGAGTPFVKTGTFDASTSTIRYTGGGATNVLSTDYYHLETKPAPASSALGNGLAFRGGASIASAGSNAALNISTNLTLDIWLKIDSPNQNSGLLYKGPGGGSQGDYALEYYANTFDFRLNGNTTIGTGRVVSSAITDSNLHHVAATYDGSKQRVWVDGVLDGEQSYSTALNTNNVGLWLANYYDGNYGFNGKVYAARVSNTVRYTGTFAPEQSWANDANTAVLWNLEDGSGTAINDSSSNNIDGSLSGNYSWVGAPVAGDGSGYTVAGSLNAGYTGDYVVNGTYGGNNKAAYTNGTNWIFNDNSEYGGEMWCMAASKSHLYDSMSCMYYTGATITGTWYPGMEATGTPVLTPLDGGYAYTLTSGTLNTTGNVINGDGTNKVILDATTNDPIVNIDGALTISANARLVASDSASFSVASNFANNGKLTDSAGTLTFDGQGLQTITAGGTDADHDFKNLTVTNASTSGVSFADSATVTGTFTDVTPSSKLIFHAASTYAFAAININGQASGTRVTMKSSTDTQHWHFNVTQVAPSVSYVSARDSDASGGNGISAVIGSQDGTGNTNWTFAGTAITVSGTVYTATNKSTDIGAGKTVALSINGDVATTVETGTGGTFSFPGVILAINNSVAVFLSGETEKGSLISQASSATNDIVGLELFTDNIALTYDTAGPMTNSILAAADNVADSDLLVSVSGSDATFTTGKRVRVIAGKKYKPGGNVTCGSFTVLSTAFFEPEANTLTMNDSGTPFVEGGTFTKGTSTIVYAGASATVVSGSNNYYNLKVNHADTTFTLGANSTISGVFTIQAGTFDAVNKTITLSGAGTPFVKTGTLTASTSTFKYTGAGDTTIAAADYYNLETKPSAEQNGGGGWVVSGTLSDSSYTGTYTASGTMNGYAKYTNGSRWLYYNQHGMPEPGYEWALAASASDCFDPYSCTAYYQYPANASPNSGTWYAAMDFTGTPTLAAAPAAYNYTLASGTFNLTGSYTNGDGTNSANVNADTNDPVINIDGSFTNSAKATFVASASAALSVASDFSNAATGKFTDSGGTLTFDGQGLQTITAGGTDADHDFKNITITNADSTNGVAFADSVTATGTFTDVTASSKITFNSGSTYAFNAININGQAVGTRISLTSSSSGTPWNLNITAASPTAANVSVKDSNANKDIDATTGGYDNTGNTHWLFPVSVYVSGTVYTAENKGSNIGANKTVALSINGGAKITDETDASGIFRFDDVNIGANNPILLYLDGETEKASLVTIAADGTSAITSLEMFTNRIVLTHASAGPVSNSVLATADNACTADCLFSLDGSSVATFSNSYEVFIPSTKTYTPGAAVIMDDIEVDGTLTLAGNAATVHGSWDSADGYFSSSGTVTFDAASGTETLNTGGAGGDGGWTVTNTSTIGDSSYGGTYTPSGNTFNGQPTYTNGSRWLYYNYDEFMCMCNQWVMYTSVANMADASYNAGYSASTTLPGTWYENYMIMNGPAPILQAVTAHGGTFTNLTKSGGGTLQLASNKVKVDGTLSIAASNTFDINGQNMTLATLSNDGTLKLQGGETATITTFDADSGTIEYAGASSYDSLILGNTYENLKINGSGGTWVIDADLTVSGVLDINAGTLNASSKTITLSGSGTPFVVTGTFAEGTSTVAYTGSSATNVAGTTYNNLKVNQAGTTFTAVGDLMVRNTFTIQAGTFDASNKVVTLNGSGTPFVNSGTFTASTSTVKYTGYGEVNITPATYYNVEFDNNAEGVRKAISVANTSGSTLTDHQVKVELTSSNFNFLSSTLTGDDIRFKDSNGTTDLSYWIESWNYAGSAATIWVKVPSIPTTGTTIYLHYGDSALSAASNGNETFDFFDDFSGDLSKWTKHTYPENISISNGYLLVSTSNMATIGSDATYDTFGNGIIEGSVYTETNSLAEVFFRKNAAANTGYKGRMDARGGQGLMFLNAANGYLDSCSTTGTPFTPNAWKSFKISANGSSFTIVADGQTKTCTDSNYTSGEIGFTSWGTNSRFDNIRVRKYASTDPSASVGAETNLSGVYTFAGNTTVNGNATITSGTVKGSTRTIDIKGNWTNAGAFTKETSTILFSGTTAQTITAGGSAFNNLTITNASAAGVSFADSATVSGTFSDVTPSSKVTFNSGSTYAFNAININGQATGTRVTLTSSSSGTPWNLNVAEASPTASNVSVKDSNANKDIDATTGGEDLTGNTHWLFPSVGITISGTVYTAENKTTNIGANKTIALSVNGAAATTVETLGDGTFSFDNIAVTANSTIAIFIDGEVEKGSYISQAANENNITGIELYAAHIVLSHQTAGPMTNALLDTADNVADSDLLISISGSDATFTSKNKIWILGTKTYTPGGNIACGSMEILATGTFTPESNTITLNDSGTPFITAGTFNVDTSTVNYAATDATSNIAAGTYYNLGVGTVADGNAGRQFALTSITVTVENVLTIGNPSSTNSDTLAVTASTLNLNGSGTPLNKTTKGSFPGGSTNGTINYNGEGPTNIASGTYYFLGIGVAADTKAGTTYSLSGDIVVATSLTIGNTNSTNSDTLFLSNYALNVTRTLQTNVISVSAKGLFDCGTGTVVYSGKANIAALTYYNLSITPTLSSSFVPTVNGAITVENTFLLNPTSSSILSLTFKIKDSFTVHGTSLITKSSNATSVVDTNATYNYPYSTGTLDLRTGGTLNLNASQFTLSGSGDVVSNTGTFNGSAATVVYTGSSATSVAALDCKNLTVDHSGTTFTAAGDTNISGVFTIANGTFNASSASITLAGAGTPFVNNGTLTPGSSTFVYSGSSSANITGTTYYNLKVNQVGSVFTPLGSIEVQGIFTIQGGTFNASNQTIILSGIGTPFVNSDIFTVGTSTIKFTGDGDTTIAAMDYYNLETSPSGQTIPPNYTFASGTINVNGSYVNGDGNHAVVTTADTNNPVLNIDGNFTNSTSATFIASATAALSVASNFTNSGVFTDSAGTLTLDGQGLQTITAGGTGANQDFNNLTITNASVAGVSFADSTTVNGTFTDVTASSKLTFHALSTYAFAAININGQAANTKISMVSSDPTNGTVADRQWYLNVSGTSPQATFVNVTDSDASGGNAITPVASTNGGNNENWLFGITISGTVYTAENKSANIGANKTIALSVNGAAATTVETTTGGVFTFGSIAVAADNAIALFIDGETEKASLITQATDNTTSISTLELYTGNVVLTHQTVGPMTNTLLATADNIDDADALIAIDGSNIATFSAGITVWVPSGKTYAPGAAVSASGFNIDGTFNPGSNNLTIHGSWDANNGIVTSNGTVTFDGTSGTISIGSGGQSFNNLVLNDGGGSATFRITTALDVNGTFTLTDGILDLDNNDPTVNIAGNVTINGGSITKSSANALVTLDGDLTYDDNVGGINFGAIQIGTSPDTTDLASDLSCSSLSIAAGDVLNTNGYEITSTGDITIAGTATLDATDDVELDGTTITLGGNWSNSGTFTAATSTVLVTGSSSQIGASNFNNLTIQNSITSANTATVTGNLTIAGNLLVSTTSTGGATMDLASNDPNIELTGNLSFTKSSTGVPALNMGDGTWTVSGDMDFRNSSLSANASTLIMNGASKTIHGSNITLNNVRASNHLATDDHWAGVISISGTLTVDVGYNLYVGAGQTLRMNAGSSTVLNGDVAYGGGGAYIGFYDSASNNISGSGHFYSHAIFVTQTADVTIYPRNFDNGLILKNDDSSNANHTVTLGTASGQSFRSGRMSIQANYGGNLTVDGSVYNPTMYVYGLICEGTGSGTEYLKLGTGNWTSEGDVTFAAGTNTVVAGSSTFTIRYVATFNPNGQTLNNFTQYASNPHTITLAGDLNVAGNMLISTNWELATFDNSVNNNNVTVVGNLSYSGPASKGAIKMGNGTWKVGGNVDFTNVTVTPGNSTLELNGSGAQTLTTNDQPLSNLTISNASASGVTLADSETLSGTFTDITASSKVIFTSGSTYAFGAINIDGQATTSRIILTSTDAGSAWNLNIAAVSPVASNVSVRDSNANKDIDATTGGFDSSGNTHWLFPQIELTISGTVYIAENKSTNIGAGKTVALSINGAAVTTVETISGGAFSFENIPVAANNTIALFIDGETEKASLVSQVSGADNIEGLELYTGHIVLTHHTAGPMTNTLLDTADNVADADMLVSVSAGNATFVTGNKVWISGGKTYAPGGNVTLGSLDILSTATFSPEANTVTFTDSGTPFSINGIFNEATATIIYAGSSATNVAATTYNNLTVNHTGTTFSSIGNSTVKAVFTISAGTFNASDDTLTLSGSGTPFVNNDTFVESTSHIVYSGSDTTNITGSTYNDITLTNGGYYQEINIANGSGSTLTDYQVKINLSAFDFDFSKSSNDGRDIRFYDSDNSTALSYYIYSWDQAGQTAVIWVKVPSILSSGTTIYIHYGDDSLTTTSSGDDTFMFFDDFSGSSIDTAKWPSHSGETVGSGTATLNLSTDSVAGEDYIWATDFAVPIGSVIDMRNKSAAVNSRFRFGITDTRTTFYANSINYFGTQQFIDGNAYSDINSGGTLTQDFAATYDTSWHDYSFVWASNSAKYYRDGTLLKSYTSNVPTVSASMHPYIRDDGQVDIVWVRKYASIEPTFAFGQSLAGKVAAGNITARGVFNVSQGVFDALDKTITLSGNGTPFVIGGTFISSTSTILYDGSPAVNITAAIYNNLKVNQAGTTFTSNGNTTVKSVFTIQAGTFNADDDTMTFTGAGTPFVKIGTFTPGTSTIKYQGSSATNITSADYYTLESSPTSGSPTHTLPSGSMSISNNLNIGNGTNAVVMDADTNDPVISISGSFELRANATYAASASATLSVGIGWNNAGTFTSNSGTVAFTGSTTIQGSTTFGNLTITAPGSSISFTAATTQTIVGIWTVTGTSDNHVVLQRSGESGTWNVVPGATSINYATVSNSTNQNSGNVITHNSTDGGSNVKWIFNAPANSKNTDNLSQVGSGRSAVFKVNHFGNAFTVMTDGASNNEDSWNGQAKTEDYWGIAFDSLYNFNQVIYMTGGMFGDGGWFASGLKVQVRQDAGWVDVSGAAISPAYPYNNTAGAQTNYTISFDNTWGDAIRVYGAPGGSAQFTSVGEFGSYYIDNGAAITGTVYSSENKSTDIGANKTIALSINGAAATTVETTSGGNFTFSRITIAANNTIAVFVSGETEKASFISQVVDGTTDITGIELYTAHIVLTHNTAGPMTNTLLDTADNVADTDLLASVSAGAATFTTGNEVWILGGKTYTPGGNLTMGSLDVLSTANFTPEANTVTFTDSGTPFAINGTFNEGTSTVIYTGSSATNVAGTTYNNLTVNQTGTTFTSAGNSTIKSVFTIQAGTFDASDDILTLSGAGTPFVNAGTFTASTSTVKYTGAGDTAITATDYYNLETSLTGSGSGPVSSVSHSPSTVVDGGSAGDFTSPWYDPSYATSSDDSFAYATGLTYETNYLYASNFGYEIPEGSDIVGITAEIERYAGCTDPYVQDVKVQLHKGSGFNPANKADTSTGWPTTDTVKSYGGEDDLWDSSWSASDINSTNFGVGLTAALSPVDNSACSRVDHIKTIIYYGEPVSPSATFASGTFNINGNYTNGDGTNEVVANATTNDPIININGNFSNSAGAEFISSNSAAFSIASNFTNSATAKFADSGGTLVLDGQGLQTITSGGAGADFDFTNLTTTNASVAGVSFADSATVTGTFTDVTASSKLTFHALSTYAFAAININGQAADTKITMVSSDPTNATLANRQWYLNVSGTSPQATYVNVTDSDANGGNTITPITSTDGGNNENWLFNTAPTNDSLTFTNPLSSNIAVVDNTTEWNFEAKVSDNDGSADINYVELRMANVADSSQPYDSLKFRWIRSTDTFSEESDTQDAATITSVAVDSDDTDPSGNKWTLNFKIKLNDNFLTKDTQYAAELNVVDSSSASDTDNYDNFYQATALNLTLNLDAAVLDFANLLPGSVVTETTTSTVTCNHPNGYSLSVSDGAADDFSALLNSDLQTRIADYVGTILLPTPWVGTGMGITVYEATDKEPKWGDGITESDANNRYAGVPYAATVIHTKSGSPVSNDVSKIGYKIVVPNNQKTGAYRGNVTFTATGLID